MATVVTKFDEDSIAKIIEYINKYQQGCNANVEQFIDAISAISKDWQDEDYNVLLSYVKCFSDRVCVLADISKEMIELSKAKLSAIKQLRGYTI